MLTRRCTPDTSDKNSEIISGFSFYQSAMCGYNSCVSSVAHYHCQMCGYATNELSHTNVHKETCSRIVKNRFSPCIQQVAGSSQGSEHSLPPVYDPGNESTMSAMSVSSVPTGMQISNSGNHLYYRTGSQQSSMFNPLLSGQSQHLYSGVFSSQVGFSSQNNYPSTINGFTHMEPPPWLSDTRMSSSANSTPSLEAGRSSKTLSCNSQSMSHSCCSSRVGGLLENIGLCSPLPTDPYKSLNKESTSCQHKSAISMENQNWFCGQGMLGYSGQVSSQGIQNSIYKCSEPYPSCTMSQLGIPLNDQDLKHSSACFESSSVSKQSNMFVSSVRKSACSEIRKDHCVKFSSPKSLVDIQDQGSSCMQHKDQEQPTFDHPIMFGTVDSELHDEMYSQNSVVIQSSDERNAPLPYSHLNKNCPLSQTGILDSTKSFSTTHSSQASSAFPRCNLSSCEGLEGYLQLEGQPLYQYPHITPVTSNIDDEQTSNQGSCSGAAESDIIVEESEEEVIESEVSVEDTKSESQSRCLVCNSSNACFVHVSGITPVTSTSRVPVVTKLAQVMTSDCIRTSSFHNELICRRCLNLVDTLDSLENKLSLVKQNLIELYKGKNLLVKSSETQDKNVCEKINENNTDSVEDSASCSVPNNGVHSEETSATEQTTCEVNQDENNSVKMNEVPVISGNADDKTSDCIDKNDSDSDTEGQGGVGESNDGKFSCNVCENILDSKELLNRHLQNHSKSYNYFCDRCGHGFVQQTSFEKHLLSHAEKFRYQCEVCGKCFIQQHALEDHLRKHRGAFNLKCVHCKKGFLYASSLRVHERIHTGERPYVCQHCGKTFICISNLSSHLNLCSGEKNYACKKCDQRFASSLQLKSHVITSHDTDPQHKCDVCGKVFMKPCDLKVHSRTHSGEKPHRCEICGKCYSNMGNLNQHSKKHTKEQPFKCDLCGKGFLRKSLLERHKNQHSGERPFKCDQCAKAFASAQDLHTHVKLHNGTMKKYTCSVCGKTMNHGLKVHMRTHSGDKPYSCSECDSSFSVKSTLDKHIKLKHRNIS